MQESTVIITVFYKAFYKTVKFGDPQLNRSRDIRLKAVGDGIFGVFWATAAERKLQMMSYPACQ